MGKKYSLSHIGIIMDGNRRWAKNRGLPILEGHRRGYNKMKKVTSWFRATKLPRVCGQ